MLIMEPDGSIETSTSSTAAGTTDASLERLILLSDSLGHELATEVRSMVNAKLSSIAAQLGPFTATIELAGATG